MSAAPRITLAPPSAEDEREFLAAVRRSRALHAGLATAPSDRAGFRAWLARTADPRYAPFLARDAASGEPCAVVTLSEITRGALESAYLGVYAFVPHAGTGLTRAAVAAALDRAFGPLELHRVEANVQPTNARSLALFRGLGFRDEGYSPKYLRIAGAWRDHVRLALLAEEWPGADGAAS